MFQLHPEPREGGHFYFTQTPDFSNSPQQPGGTARTARAPGPPGVATAGRDHGMDSRPRRDSGRGGSG